MLVVYFKVTVTVYTENAVSPLLLVPEDTERLAERETLLYSLGSEFNRTV